jgi:hypothetical protein
LSILFYFSSIPARLQVITQDNIIKFWLEFIPLLWIVLFISFIFLTDYLFKKTRRGYKYSFLFISISTTSVYVGSGNQFNPYTGSTSVSESWNHFTITYNKSFNIFINGECIFTKPSTPFTSTQMTIGGTSPYVFYYMETTTCDAYIRQLCVFDTVLSNEQISILAAANDYLPLVPITGKPYSVSCTELSSTSFTVNWIYSGATSYTYTLNGSPVTPSTDDGVASQSATFTGLTAGTDYTLVITADSYASTPVVISTNPSLVVLLRGVDYTNYSIWYDKSFYGRNASLEDGSYIQNSQANGVVLNGSTSWTFHNVAVGNAWTANVWYKNTGPQQAGTSGANAAILTQIPAGISGGYTNLTIGDINGANNLPC